MDATKPPGAAAPARQKVPWIWMLRLSLGFAVLTLIFLKVPFAGVVDVLGGARLAPVLGAAALAFIMHAANADRLKRLCDAHGHAWSTWQVFQINLATRFYGFLPGGNFTGIAIRFYKLTGDKKRYLGTAVALFYDRIAATVSLCALGAVFWLLEMPSGSWLVLVAILAALIVMVAALMVMFTRRPGPVVSGLRRGLSRVGGVKLHTLRQAVRESRDLPTRQVLAVYGLSALAHLLGVLGWYLLCRSLDIDISFITIGWIRSAIILATMIPISMFGLGLRETAAVALLPLYGVSQETSLAFSLLVFAVTVLLIALAGGLCELWRLYVAGDR
jgi:glycosyltransferase 2 family protein